MHPRSYFGKSLLGRLEACLQFVAHFRIRQSGPDVQIVEPLFRFEQALLEIMPQLSALLMEAKLYGEKMVLDGSLRLSTRFPGFGLQLRSFVLERVDLALDDVLELVIVAIELAVQMVDSLSRFQLSP